MCLISFNAPDNKYTLNAINGNLADISNKLGQIGYDISGIRKELKRIADSAEVIAGIKSKEEIILEEVIKNQSERVRLLCDIGNEEELDKEHAKLIRLYALKDTYIADRKNKMLELCGEDKQ